MRDLFQFVRFALLGALGTAVHYLLLIALVTGLKQPEALGAMVGACAGAFCNYYLNRRYNFRSTRRHREALPRFLAVAGLGIVLNGVIVGFLSQAGWHYLLAQAAATILILVINFFASKTWIFVNPNN
ncbi:GtrA family protein [Pseudoduganella sp. OTU4001]|uniref:GtrA family protein n=1 Tax=Pseudoduganella sp. OTU4001 TaxID=3043854 RepID=UPI00313D551B